MPFSWSFPWLSLSKLASDLSADATTIKLDMPDGGYDQLYTTLKQRDILPRSRRDRIALVVATLSVSRIVQQRLGQPGPVLNFINELGQDGLREIAKRIIADMTSEDQQIVITILAPEKNRCYLPLLKTGR